MRHRFHHAKVIGAPTLTFWGTGTPMREFLHVDDMTDACLFLMAHYSGESHINIGTGEEVSIRDLAYMVRDVVFPEATITFDHDKPDGCPRKVLDVSKLHHLGWRHTRSLPAGIADTYAWFRGQIAHAASPPRGVDARHSA